MELAAHDLLQLLDTRGKVSDAPDAKALVLAGGAVEFKDVSFTYPGTGGGVPVLKDVRFCLVSAFC